MSNTIAKLKSSRYYGLILLGAMPIFFYGVFKILTPSNFGSLSNLYTYLQSSIIYSVGGCGLYFIVVMGLFDFAVGSNIVLSSIVGVILSQKFGYAGFILGCLCCGTFIGFPRMESGDNPSRQTIPNVSSSWCRPSVSYLPQYGALKR